VLSWKLAGWSAVGSDVQGLGKPLGVKGKGQEGKGKDKS